MSEEVGGLEYVFGENGDEETLRTKGLVDTVLEGFCTLIREYPDQNILDRFRIKERTKHIKFNDLYYNWYTIDSHYRSLDKTPTTNESVKANTENLGIIEDALCELDTTDGQMAAIEDALCELDSKGEL